MRCLPILISFMIIITLVSGLQFTETVPPTIITVQPQLSASFDRDLAGIRVGQHKTAPLTPVTMTISATPNSNLSNVFLIDYYPNAWTISNPYGGNISSYDSDYNKITWSIGDINGTTVTRSYVIVSPQRTIPPTSYYFRSGLNSTQGFAVSDNWRVIVSDPEGALILEQEGPTGPNNNPLGYTIKIDAGWYIRIAFSCNRDKYYVHPNVADNITFRVRLEDYFAKDCGWWYVSEAGKVNEIVVTKPSGSTVTLDNAGAGYDLSITSPEKGIVNVLFNLTGSNAEYGAFTGTLNISSSSAGPQQVEVYYDNVKIDFEVWGEANVTVGVSGEGGDNVFDVRAGEDDLTITANITDKSGRKLNATDVKGYVVYPGGVDGPFTMNRDATGSYSNTTTDYFTDKPSGDYKIKVAVEYGDYFIGGEGSWRTTVIKSFPGSLLQKIFFYLPFVTMFGLFDRKRRKFLLFLFIGLTFFLSIPALTVKESIYVPSKINSTTCYGNSQCHIPSSTNWGGIADNQAGGGYEDDRAFSNETTINLYSANAHDAPPDGGNAITEAIPHPDGRGPAVFNPRLVHRFHDPLPMNTIVSDKGRADLPFYSDYSWDSVWYNNANASGVGDQIRGLGNSRPENQLNFPFPGLNTGNYTSREHYGIGADFPTIPSAGAADEIRVPGNPYKNASEGFEEGLVARRCATFCHSIRWLASSSPRFSPQSWENHYDPDLYNTSWNPWNNTFTHGWNASWPDGSPFANDPLSSKSCEFCHGVNTISHGGISNADCRDACHDNDLDNTTSLSPRLVTMRNCTACHDSSSSINTVDVWTVPKVTLKNMHVGKPCEDCHSGGHNVSSVPEYNGNQACFACHDNTVTGVHSYITQTGYEECEACHSYGHNTTNPSCSTCHGPDKTGANENWTSSLVPNWITGESPIHNETGLQCTTCHGGTSPHNVTQKPVCTSCHNTTATGGKYLNIGQWVTDYGNTSVGHGNHTYNVTCMQCHNNATFVMVQRADPNGAGNLHNPSTKIFETNIHATNYTWKIPGYTDLPSAYKYNETDNVTKAIFSCGQCHDVANRTDITVGWIQPHAGYWENISNSKGVGCLNCHNGIDFNMTPAWLEGTSNRYYASNGTRLLNTTIHTTNTSEIIPGLNYSITSGYARDSVTWVRAMCRVCHDQVDNQTDPHNPGDSCITCHAGTGISDGRPAYHAIEISRGGGTNCSYCHTVYGDSQTGSGSSLIDETIFGASIHRDINSTLAWDSTNFSAMNYRCWECHLDPWAMSDPDTIRNCTSCHVNSTYTKAIQIYEHYIEGEDIIANLSCVSCHNNSLTNVTGGASVNIGDGVGDPKDNLIWVSHFGNGTANGQPVGLPDTVNCTNCHLNNTYEIYFGADNRTIDRHLNETNCWRCHSNSTVEGWLDAGGLGNLRSYGLTFHDQSLNITPLTPPVDCTACHSNTTYGFDITTAPQIEKHNATNCYYCHNETGYYVNLHNLTVPRHNDTLNVSYCGDKCHFTVEPTVPNSHANATYNCTNCHFELYNGTAPYRIIHNVTKEINCASCHEQTKNNLNFTSHADNATFFNLTTPTYTRINCMRCHDEVHMVNVTKPYWCGGCHNTTAASYYGLEPLVVHAENTSVFDRNCTICHLEIHRNETDMLSNVVNCTDCHVNSLRSDRGPQVNWTLFNRSVHYNSTNPEFQDLFCTNCHNNKKINASIHRENVTKPLCGACHEGPHNVTYTSFEETYNMTEPQRKDSWLNWW